MQENLFEYPVIIREQHLDSYGHVNNATYLQLAEEARWEMMHQLAGLDLFGLHEMGACVTNRLKECVKHYETCGNVGLHPKHSQYPSVESERLESGLTYRTLLKLGSRASNLNGSVSG